MIELIAHLLSNNGYKTLDIDLQRNDVQLYIGDEFGDIVIVTDYSKEELLRFFENNQEKTTQIMGLYEKVVKSAHSDSAKDMLLIICHAVTSPTAADEDDEIKHQIMRLEENKFGMRISVLKYTNAAISNFSDETKIAEAIINKVDSNIDQADGEIEASKTIDAALKVEPTFTALQLYAKLPFLSLRGLVPASAVIPIEQRLNQCIGEKQVQINHILELDKDTYTSWSLEEFLADIDKANTT